MSQYKYESWVGKTEDEVKEIITEAFAEYFAGREDRHEPKILCLSQTCKDAFDKAFMEAAKKQGISRGSSVG